MAYKLIIEPEAELDLQHAVNWYNEQQPGLGHDFLERIDDVLQRIREVPESNAVVHGAARLTLVGRFPYVVCYLLDGDTVSVIAVFHGHRDPHVWRERLE